MSYHADKLPPRGLVVALLVCLAGIAFYFGWLLVSAVAVLFGVDIPPPSPPPMCCH